MARERATVPQHCISWFWIDLELKLKHEAAAAAEEEEEEEEEFSWRWGRGGEKILGMAYNKRNGHFQDGLIFSFPFGWLFVFWWIFVVDVAHVGDVVDVVAVVCCRFRHVPLGIWWLVSWKLSVGAHWLADLHIVTSWCSHPRRGSQEPIWLASPSGVLHAALPCRQLIDSSPIISRWIHE